MCKARAYGARAWLANQQNPGAYGAPGVIERLGVKGTIVVTVIRAYYLPFSSLLLLLPFL